jgi:hypothetical protein
MTARTRTLSHAAFTNFVCIAWQLEPSYAYTASCLFAVLLQVNTWRLAAEQAADLAEAANKRAASCDCKLADTAQQLAEQARATLKLGEDLKQARCQLDDRRVLCGTLVDITMQRAGL